MRIVRLMITPETKIWTWVLERSCPECGFDASATRAVEVATLARTNADDWRRLGATGAIHAGRPDDSTWSSLEYACHVRDVYGRFDARLEVMLAEDDPVFANWDQDASAVEERYEEQDPAVVVADLGERARAIAARLDAIADAEWSRTGRRSDGARFTVDTISRYMAHDFIHHVWDVEAR